MDSRQTLEYFERRRDAVVEDIRSLVDIESPSHNVEQSRKVVDRIVSMARAVAADLEIERIHADNCGDHLLIRAFPSDRRPVLVLGHTDTVHPIGTNVRNPTRIEGDRFYGCGIFDMKANIALLLSVLRYFAETGTRPERPISIFLSCDEEVGSRTGRPIVESEAPRSEVCLVLEPSLEGKVKTGRKGTGMFTLSAHGIPAHAGLEPEKGASAILELARQIERIDELNDAASGTTVNVCMIKGGTTSNVIPEYADCEIDVRFTSESEAQRVDRTLRELKPFDPRVSLALTGEINRPPMERTEPVAALYERARKIAATFDYEIGEAQVGGGSDGNFVAALGVPVLDGLGIAGTGAHTLDEHVLVSDIAKRTALITLLLSE